MSVPDHPETVRPWHREPMLWLVIAIPLATAIAGGVTYALIAQHADQVVRETVPVTAGDAAR